MTKNDTGGPSPFLDQSVESHALQTPDRIALIDAQGETSYGELAQQVRALAHRLTERSVEPGSLVGISLERSREMVVAVLATWRSGAAHVPIDAGTLNPGRSTVPVERLRFMLDDIRPQIVLSDDRLANVLSDAGAEILDPRSVASEDVELSTPFASANDLAYVIYTSGSTGEPNGVMVERESVMRLWESLNTTIYDGYDSPLRVSINSPLGFDPSVQQLAALAGGHTIVVVPEEIRTNGKELLRFIQSHRIDVWDVTPSQLRLMLSVGLAARDLQYPKAILCGGEKLDRDTWQELSGLSGIAAYNLYGPTECTVDTTCARVTGTEPHIGVPLPHAEVYMLDDDRNQVEPGVEGELYIGGSGVARGYWNRPELTAERFVELPSVAEGRLFRSGDIGWRDEEGTLHFVARHDDQVKVRSHRIELGEVAAAIRRHERITDGVAILDERGDPIGYYVEVDSPVETLDLRAHLSQWLPEYMLPAKLIVTDEIPLTPNGKLDRAALPPPSDDRERLGVEYVAPRTELEVTIASLWRRVLEYEGEIGLLDDFFLLGGDSLRAVSLLAEFEESFSSEVPLETMLDLIVEHSVLGEQADALGDAVYAGTT
jgi:amino acid adenylation domain-containing protein